MTRTALVTGANRGIGRAVVDNFLADGIRVIGLYRTPGPESEDLERVLASAEPGGMSIRCDISDESQVAAALAAIGKHFGYLDIVVNNAGIAEFATLADLDRTRWDHMLAVNLTGPYLVTRAALPMLRPGASIVSISSGLGLVGAPGKTHYAATKAALLGFTKSLSREVGRRGIRVNAVAPGMIDTDMSTTDSDRAVRGRYEAQAALGRTGRPTELADVVAFLASEKSSYVSGQAIMVDGGM